MLTNLPFWAASLLFRLDASLLMMAITARLDASLFMMAITAQYRLMTHPTAAQIFHVWRQATVVLSEKP